MELNFLGMGSAFNPDMHNSNAYFCTGRRFCLLDCGESTFGKIWNLPSMSTCDEVVVLITHLHADHVGSLGSLISYTHYVARKPITVMHPLDTVVRLLDLLGINRDCYHFIKLPEAEEYSLDGTISLKAIQVDHVPDMTCFGYLMKDAVESVYFSGDAKTIPAEILKGLEDGSISRLYQDTSIRESDHATHASLASLEGLLPRHLRGKVYCMHLDYDYRELLHSKGFGTVTLEG